MSGNFTQDDFEVLKSVISALSDEQMLERKFHDHALKGDWKGYRECHIKPDWLLVYQIDHSANTLKLARLGTHNQIFNR